MAAALILQPFAAFAQERKVEVKRPIVEVAPPSSPEVSQFIVNPDAEPVLTTAQKWALIQQNIKYVFVLFQESRSFDFYFGTYPGAKGLFSQPAARTPGFVQPLVNTDGSVTKISPFLIPQTVTNTSNQTVSLYPEDTDSVNHTHLAMDAKLHLDAKLVAHNDRYAVVEEGVAGGLSADGTTYTGPAPTLAQKQQAELAVSHVDCDTAPLLWSMADRFTLFDNFNSTVIGPSTPNAIAIIAGQSGETQWARHPQLGANITTTNAALPVTGEPQPYWGSALDTLTPVNEKQPTDGGGAPAADPASNLTFASLPLSFMGNQVQSITAQDLNPASDLVDIRTDIRKLATSKNAPINWAWYQEGYDREPNEVTPAASHSTYIAHHNAPQYFGYEANNPAETSAHLKGLGDFFIEVQGNQLPADGGVFYIRGGYGNLDNLKPRSPSASVKANFKGNDDHPGYSDAQISEALLADEINTIAASPYWPNSAIIITYDETDGLYDHVPPTIRSWDALGDPLDQGPRVPAIVISPYSMVHAVTHERSEHGSVIKFIEGLYNLIPLFNLPDEFKGRLLGNNNLGQTHISPSDGVSSGTGALLSAFDNGRLAGSTPPLKPGFAIIPQQYVTTLPHFGGHGCSFLKITPTDYVNGKLLDPAPADFNPRPSSNPGLPTTPGWPTN